MISRSSSVKITRRKCPKCRTMDLVCKKTVQTVHQYIRLLTSCLSCFKTSWNQHSTPTHSYNKVTEEIMNNHWPNELRTSYKINMHTTIKLVDGSPQCIHTHTQNTPHIYRNFDYLKICSIPKSICKWISLIHIIKQPT